MIGLILGQLYKIKRHLSKNDRLRRLVSQCTTCLVASTVKTLRAGTVQNRKTETVNREPKTAVPMRFGFAKKPQFRCRFR